MDDRIRVSDADREHVTGRLREHFAEGRLAQDELDERISAALNAKTFGDLRPVMADLPEPVPAPPRPAQPQRAGPPVMVRHRGPPLLPLLLLAVVASLVIPGGGWVLFAFLKVMLVFWLIASVTGFLIAGLAHRHVRHHRRSGYNRHWDSGYTWRGRYTRL
jgi:Domain of unknown function (DUF1707)